MRITEKTFFEVPAPTLAPKLLGKILCRKTDDGEILRFRITETEAYCGSEDTACHAHKGLTKRTAPLFERGGTVYVYLCYGLFDILNIVSGVESSPEGVMIRGLEGIAAGPGRASRALHITRALNMEDITTSSKIWLETDNFTVPSNKIEYLKRVGISYASKEDQEKLWRFRLTIDKK